METQPCREYWQIDRSIQVLRMSKDYSEVGGGQQWEMRTVTMFTRLNDEVNRYNRFTAADSGKAYMQQYVACFEDKQNRFSHWQEHSYCKPKEVKQQIENLFVLAAVTPLMAGVHQLVQQAGEMVFCDATASLDRLCSNCFCMGHYL